MSSTHFAINLLSLSFVACLFISCSTTKVVKDERIISRGIFKKTVNGNTFVMEVDRGKEVKVSLWGVAALNDNHPFRERSESCLRKLLKDAELIEVQEVKKHGMEAVLGNVWVEISTKKLENLDKKPLGMKTVKVNVNEALVFWGMAKHDSTHTPDTRGLSNLQEKAKINRVGIWEEGLGTVK